MAGLREALEETYDAIDAGEDPSAIEDTQVEAAPEAEAGEVDTRERDESGRFVANPAEQETSAPSSEAPLPTKPSAPAGQGAATGAVPPGIAPVAAPSFKAPQSWKANVREKWAALPPEVQGEVIRREKEVATALQSRAEAEKGYNAFNEVVRPYEAQIRAAGAQPHQYVGDLLKTAHALTYGHNKADVLADIIMQFQVAPQDLDTALVARMQARRGQGQPQGNQGNYRDPRVDQLMQQLEQGRQDQTAAAAAEADQTANSFAEQHEFFDDVAGDIANLLDVWKAQGKTNVSEADLQRAYDIACNLNPDVATVLSQRKAASSVQTVQAATARARAAASSVRSQPTAAVSAQPSGRRAALEAAFDELDR